MDHLVCKKKKLILLVFLAFTVFACNFPVTGVSIYADDISFPTSRPWLTPSAIALTPEAGEVSDSYMDLIRSPMVLEGGVYRYIAQSGDTLVAVAIHFGVQTGQISSNIPIDPTGNLPPGQLLLIPDALGVTYRSEKLLPDSEVINSLGSADFDVPSFVLESGGYLADFHQKVGTELLSGAEIVKRVADDASINPRLLLAIIEYRSHWLTTTPETLDLTYPLGFHYAEYQGFYQECALAAKWLNKGYYGWREGQITSFDFFDGNTLRISPQSNAGTVALQYFFAQLHPFVTWEANLYGEENFLLLYQNLFGDFWHRAETVEPIFTTDVVPPLLELPFAPGEEWALTGGLHVDWTSGTPTGALDFAPLTGEPRCSTSRAWVRASAAGVVTQSSNSIVVIALEDEQSQKTGWEVFYMHIAQQDSIPVGTRVKQDDPIGHPSCEGGITTGTHVHFARKYMGEWIGAGDPFPLVVSGWIALPGEQQFKSSLVNGAQIVTANQNGASESWITR